MSTDATSRAALPTHFEQLRYAREIIQIEGQAILQLADTLGDEFCEAVRLISECSGCVIVTGIGKAGWIGQKISATLASTGTRSHFLHPGEAFHGDLGRIRSDDVILAFSQSGETEEVTRMLPAIADFAAPIIAVTARRTSTLGRAAQVVIEMGELREACSLGLAPSTSTAVMHTLGDALALVASHSRGFRAEDFARFHPGGSLGRKLSRVDDHLRPLAQCRIAGKAWNVREVFMRCVKPGRRTGAIMVLDEQGKLSGIFTDSDLARLFERREEPAFDHAIEDEMTPEPSTVLSGTLLRDALNLMARRKISELPVVDEDDAPVGLIDITDVVGLLPDETPLDDRDETSSTPAEVREQPSHRPATIPYRSKERGTHE